MKESEFSFDKHPLWPLSRLITQELLETLTRLEASGYTDENEMDFQIFLQDEARERVTVAILPDVGDWLKFKDSEWYKLYITDPVERKNYEKGWSKLFLGARINNLSGREMQEELDSLFEIWKNARKDILHFSPN